MCDVVDKTWITLRHPNPLFRPGVKSFLNFVKKRLPGIKKIKCPCTQCNNMRISLSYEDVEFHLIRYGFSATYKVWKFHGEVVNNESTQGPVDHHNENHNDMSDHFTHSSSVGIDGNLGGDRQETMGEMHDRGEVTQDDPSSEFAKVEEFMKVLYPGSDLTVGAFSVQLFDIKMKHGVTDKGISDFLEFFKKVLPKANEVPSTTYRAEKIIEDVSLGYEKIDACRNDCILYWDKYADLQKCPTCNAPRYKVERVSNKYPVRKPVKVLWYFPITQRLKRMFSVPWVAKEMEWHKNGRMPDGKMGHPVDSSVWRSLDKQYPDFKAEPRNVRLGLATDGFNPFGNFSSSYSCWPVMCVPYNLPPNLCMRPEFTMLSLLIPGPKQPGNDIDVYLQPLVRELEGLWDEGAVVFDANKGADFTVRAALLWTIHDYPAYGNISGCQTKGKFSCAPCGPKIDSLRLRYGRKHVYANFRRWLSLMDELRNDTNSGTFNGKEEMGSQPIRLDGIEVENMTSKLDVQWGKGKKRKRVVKGNVGNQNNDAANCFTKHSILFNLKYWKYINVRHNLDVMHVEKNVCEILIALMLNTKEKTKDDANARRDLKHLKLKKRLWIKLKGGKLIQSPCRFWLKTEEKKLFLLALKNLRVPIGFSSNWNRMVTSDGMDLKCLKSHDYHILMQHLLPMLIQHAYKDRKEVSQIIRYFSTFFNALCSRIIDVDTLVILERGMARTMCELEKICPPSLFVVMMHLPIHLAYEARVCGPVYYRWMYPFERFMKKFKGYVGNKARPEACIAERYIKEEAVVYCKSYKVEGEAVFKPSNDNNGILDEEADEDVCKNGDGCKLVGLGKKSVMTSIEYEQARRWVLKSHPSYDMWKSKYEKLKRPATKKSGFSRASSEEEFIVWLKKQLQSTKDQEDFVNIVKGPRFFARRFKRCRINGFQFVTKDREETKSYQNSGVSTKAVTTCRATAKDKSPVEEQMDYYGVLKDIIQLEYTGGYSPILFKCDWVKVTHNGVKCDKEAGLILVNLSNTSNQDQLTDEPFILAEHAQQVFYSADPKNVEWHVVLDVPTKVYTDDESRFISNQPVIRDGDEGPTNNDAIIDDELLFNEPEDFGVVVEKRKKKRSRKN